MVNDGAKGSNGDLIGTVVAVQANFYQVSLDLAEKTLLLCTRRTRLKKLGQKIMVGDRVIVVEPDYTDGSGAIAEVLPRKSELSRPPVANCDQILLVFALAEPPLDPWQLTRFLIKAEATNLDLCLCLNKSDLISSEEREKWQKQIEAWGYQPILISVTTGQGLAALKSHLQHQISIVAGPSGVGKSSLINNLIPNLSLRIGQVSGKLSRGRHTTRHVELFELPDGGLLADSPGFNQPDLDCEPNELIWYFPEARARLSEGECQFNDCLHRDEPNCLVRGDWQRYEYYLEFLKDAIARQDALHKTTTPESNLKLKIKSEGERHYEPKLESKKYRRLSRREKHQNLHEFYDNQPVDDIEDW